MRYKVSFEFDTNLDVSGNPVLWHWQNLLRDLEDEDTTVDFESLTVYYQTWEEV